MFVKAGIRPVSLCDLECDLPQVAVLLDAGLWRGTFSKNRRGVFGNLYQFGSYQGIQPDEIPEHGLQFRFHRIYLDVIVFNCGVEIQQLLLNGFPI